MQAGFPLLLRGKPTSGRARRACRLVFPYFYEEKLACKLVFPILVEEIAVPESRLEGSAAAGEVRGAYLRAAWEAYFRFFGLPAGEIRIFRKRR